MVDETAISPFQPFAQMFGGQQGVTPGLGSAGGAVGGGVNNMISALMKGYHDAQTPAPTGTYEGNIQTPANPFSYSNNSFGMSAKPEPIPGVPPPHPGGTAPPLPTNPFVGGAPPTPFLSSGALFSPPPMR